MTRLAAVPAVGSHRAQVTEQPPSIHSPQVLVEPPAARILLCPAVPLSWSSLFVGRLRVTEPGAPGLQWGILGGASMASRAQAGRARGGLADSSPLLFPKQPARRCHTRAHGCTRKPSHSPCGKEASATTCEYCPRVVLPLPLVLRAKAVTAARLQGRECEHRAVPCRGLSGFLAPLAKPPDQGRV